MREKEAIESERKNLQRVLEKQDKVMERLREAEKNLRQQVVRARAFLFSLNTESERLELSGSREFAVPDCHFACSEASSRIGQRLAQGQEHVGSRDEIKKTREHVRLDIYLMRLTL